jgi:hypothetical protein
LGGAGGFFGSGVMLGDEQAPFLRDRDRDRNVSIPIRSV